MKHSPPIRVVVADDHPLFRQGLCALLRRSREVEVVGEAANGEEAVLQVRDKKPDILLLDLKMPLLDGIEVTRILARRAGSPKIVVLSCYEDDERVRAAIRAGACGYVAKRVEMQELIKILKGAICGAIPVSPYLVDMALDPNAGQPPKPRLTEKEHEVLQLLVEGRPNREIGKTAYMSTDTVKVHLKTLFSKLHVRNRTQAAVTAVQMGLVPYGPEAVAGGKKALRSEPQPGEKYTRLRV